jgi:hypothetical protein
VLVVWKVVGIDDFTGRVVLVVSGFLKYISICHMI